MSPSTDIAPRRRSSISFVALYQNARQRVRTFSGPLIVLGRAKTCDFVLDSASVAPVHAAIVFCRGACFACDLGATRGTLVNGSPIRYQRLSEGDQLQIGNYRFRVEGIHSGGDEQASAPRFTLSGPPPIGQVNCMDPLTVIGSDLGADLVIRDARVAGVQCLIAWTDDGVLARDVGGAGVMVNGRTAAVEVLRAGDVIVIGPHDVRFDVDSRLLPGGAAAAADALAAAAQCETAARPDHDASNDLSLADTVDAHWPETLTEAEEMNLDVELSRDIRDLDDARRHIGAAKDALERERIGADEPPVLSSDTLNEVMAGGMAASTAALSAGLDAERRAIAAERAMLAAEKANVDAQRSELESQRRQIAASRAAGEAAQQEAERRRAELDEQVRKARELHEQLERERAELARLRGETDAQTKEIASLRARQRQELSELVAQRSAIANEIALLSQRKQDGGDSQELSELRAALESARAELEAARGDGRRLDAENQALKKQSLRDRTQTNELMAELESVRRERDAIRSKTLDDFRARQAELDNLSRELAARAAAADRRAAEVEQREKAVAQRLSALRERVAAEQKKLDDHAAGLRRSLDEQRDRQKARQAELEELSAKIEATRDRLTKDVDTAFAERSREVEERTAALAERESTLTRQAEENARRSAELTEREDRVTRTAAEITQREATLNALEAALQDRDGRLREWQERLTREDVRIEGLRQQSEAAAREAAAAHDRVAAERAGLEARRDAIAPELQKIEIARAALDERAEQIDQLKRSLDQREAQLAARQNELETWAARLSSQEEQLDDAVARIDEAKRREEAVAAGEAGLLKRMAQADLRQAELEALRARVERRSEDVESRERTVQKHETVLAEAKAAFEVERQEVLRGRDEARALREEAARIGEEAHRLQAEMQRRGVELDQLEMTLRAERQQLDDRQQQVRDEQTRLKLAQEALTRDLAALERERNELDQRGHALAAEKDALITARAEADALRGRVEARDVELGHEQRRLAERQAELDTRAAELERRAGELAERRAESEAEAAVLKRERENLRLQSEALAERQGDLDARQTEIERQARTILHDEAELNRGRAELSEAKAALTSANEQLEAERRSLEQMRLTYAAGLSQLEIRQRELAERELAVTEQSRQAAAIQARMESELDRLGRERAELLAVRESGAADVERFRVLEQQLESQRADLRRQEESLVAHERALQARTEQLTQIEQHVQSRSREMLDRIAGLDRDREELERQRAAWQRQAESERAAIEASRASAVQELEAARARHAESVAAAREELAARRAELEREFGEYRDGVEETLRHRLRAEAQAQAQADLRRTQEALANAESRLAGVDQDIAERLRRFEAEMRQRRAELEAEFARRRDSFDAELDGRRRAVDVQADELARREAAISEEEALIREETAASSPSEPGRSGEQTPRFAALADLVHTAPSAAEDTVAADVDRHDPSAPPSVDDADELDRGSERAERSPDRGAGRRRSTAILTMLVSVSVFAAMWAARDRGSAVGTVQLPSGTDRAALLARLGDNAFLRELSAAAGADVPAAVGAGRLKISVGESDDRLRIEADSAQLADGVGLALRDALNQSPAASPIPQGESLADLRAIEQKRRADLAAAEGKLAQLGKAINADDSDRKLVEAEKTKKTRRAALDEAERAEAAAAKALAEAKVPDPGVITVSDQELSAALADDPPYMESLKQCKSKAKGLREEIVRVDADVAPRFERLTKAAGALQQALAAERAQPNDAQLTTSLTRIEQTLVEFAQRAGAWGTEWAGLMAPIVRWPDGGEADVLLTSHQKAVDWYHRTEADARQTADSVGRMIDAMTSGGGDMARRRVVESALQKPRRELEAATAELLASAAAILGRENFKIHALSEAVTDLDRRARRRREAISDAVRSELQRTQSGRSDRDLTRARNAHTQAKAKRDAALRELLAIDEEVAMLRRAAERSRSRRDELTAAHVEIAQIKEDLQRIAARIEQASAAPTPQPAEVTYVSQTPFLTNSSGPAALVRPAASGLLAGLLFALLHRMLTGRRQPTPEHATA